MNLLSLNGGLDLVSSLIESNHLSKSSGPCSTRLVQFRKCLSDSLIVRLFCARGKGQWFATMFRFEHFEGLQCSAFERVGQFT